MAFFSSSNCRFVLNRYSDSGAVVRQVDISNAYAIRVNRTDGVMPYYSWSKSKLRKFVDGTTLVEGALILNISDTGYLPYLINGNGNGEGNDTRQSALANIEDNINNATAILESRVTDLNIDNPSITHVVDQDDIIKLARLRRSVIDQKREIQVGDTSLGKSTIKKEVELRVITPSGTEVIEQVRFTGKSYEVTAGSAMNIKYAFPFVAADCSI